MTYSAKINFFLLPKFKVDAILGTVAMYFQQYTCTLISHILWFKVYRKGGSKFTQAYHKVYVYSTVVLYSK